MTAQMSFPNTQKWSRSRRQSTGAMPPATNGRSRLERRVVRTTSRETWAWAVAGIAKEILTMTTFTMMTCTMSRCRVRMHTKAGVGDKAEAVELYCSIAWAAEASASFTSRRPWPDDHWDSRTTGSSRPVLCPKSCGEASTTPDILKLLRSSGCSWRRWVG